MNRDINIVEHIIIYCKRIIEKTDNISKDEFLTNKDITDIVCFNYLQAGELVKLLSMSYREKYLPGALSKIAGLRGKIAMVMNQSILICFLNFLKQEFLSY